MTVTKQGIWLCPYEILGIPKFSQEQQVRDAYRAKLLETHPDSGSGNLEAFDEVMWAYKLLSDPEKKAQYDEFLRNHSRMEAAQREAYLKMQWQTWMSQLKVLQEMLEKEDRKKLAPVPKRIAEFLRKRATKDHLQNEEN